MTETASVQAVRKPVILPDEERARVLRVLRKRDRAERELGMLMVAMVEEGKPIAALARELGMSRPTFYAALARWREEQT